MRPHDHELAFNLGFIEKQYGLNNQPDQSWFQQKYQGFIRLIPRKKARLVTLILYWVTLMLVILALYFRKKALSISALTLSIVFLVMLVFIGLQWYHASRHQEAVVLTNQAPATYSADLDEDTAFTLPEGTVVTILDTRNGSLKIQTVDDQIGWIKADDLGQI